MSLFHSHQWQEAKRWFVPPCYDIEVERSTVEFGYDMANGYTVVELQCSGCGDVTSRKLRGDGTQ
jgi:hypothetical protein